MHYSEIIVTNQQLKENVLCYWQMKASIPVSNNISSRYVPKGQSLLVFNFGDVIKLPTEVIDSPFFVVPMIASSLMINQSGNIDLFGVSFIGDGLFKLLQEPLQKINQDLPEHLHRRCNEIYEKLKGDSLEDKSGKMETFLSENLDQNLKNEKFDQAIQNINQKKGKIKIGELCKGLHISERHLQRLFKNRLGLSPKVFCKIVRVNNYIGFILEKSKSVDWMDLVVEFEYHDQPHLITEVKAISKLPPQKLMEYKDTLFHHYRHG